MKRLGGALARQLRRVGAWHSRRPRLL